MPMPRNRFDTLMALSRFAVQDKSLMLLTQGLGPQSFHGRVIVLVNEWTTSAGEMAAAFAAEMGLAKVIGRKTKGAVLGAMNFDVGHGYWLRLPVFGWFTAGQRCLEGDGVTPDVSLATHSPESCVMIMRSSEPLTIWHNNILDPMAAPMRQTQGSGQILHQFPWPLINSCQKLMPTWINGMAHRISNGLRNESRIRSRGLRTYAQALAEAVN